MTKLKELNLSTRLNNVLVKLGFTSVESLDVCSDEELKALKGISIKSVDEIRTKIKEFKNREIESSFKENKTYIFTKKAYIKALGRKAYSDNKEFVNSLNGRIVDKNGYIEDCKIQSEWCICK